MNQPHGLLTRGVFALMAWWGALFAARSLTLAHKLAIEFWQDKFYTALRKSARFARYLSPKFNILNDPFFDFTSGADKNELDALKKHLMKTKKRIPAEDFLTDLLYIQAAQIHLLLINKQDASPEIDSFYKLANQVLKMTRISDNSPEDQPIPTSTDDFSLSEAREALNDIANLLPNDKWPWYIISGTFLGLHREGGFLSHDYDIDLGINAEDIQINDLLEKLQNNKKITIGKLDYHYEVLSNGQQRTLKRRLSIIKLVHKNGLQIDFFIHYTENGRCWHGSSIHRWENTPFELTWRKLEGIPVLAPADGDLYLTENYGDWRTPVKEFDCTTGTPNLVVAKNFISLALFIKRYSYFAKHDKNAAVKLLHTMQASSVFSLENEKGHIELVLRL